MSMTIAEHPMTKRTDVSTKIDTEAVRIARNVATYRGQSLAEYLSEVVLAAAARDWKMILEKEQNLLPPTSPKGKGAK